MLLHINLKFTSKSFQLIPYIIDRSDQRKNTSVQPKYPKLALFIIHLLRLLNKSHILTKSDKYLILIYKSLVDIYQIDLILKLTNTNFYNCFILCRITKQNPDKIN